MIAVSEDGGVIGVTEEGVTQVVGAFGVRQRFRIAFASSEGLTDLSSSVPRSVRGAKPRGSTAWQNCILKRRGF